MSMMYRCSKCRKKIAFGETCECMKDSRRETKNKSSKKYYDENKEYLNKINVKKWHDLRRLIIQRDGGYCQRCYVKFQTFTVDRLEVHHIKPRIDFPELVYDDKNLITICKQCNIDLGTSHTLDFEITIKDIDHNI